MIVLGIDPGSLNVGFAWVRYRATGKVNSRYMASWRAAYHLPTRYIDIRDHLERQLLGVPEYPSVVAVEVPAKPYHAPYRPGHHRDIKILHGCYAVIVAEVGRVFRNTFLLPVQYDVWTGGLDKKEIQGRLARKYEISSFVNDDCADALGIADYAFEIARRRECGQKEKEAEAGRSHSLLPQAPAPESAHETGS